MPHDAAYLPPATFSCTAKLNTGGCQALASLEGGSAASVSSNVPFRVESTGVVPNVLGLLFSGTSGRRAVPFMGGFHCVEPPVTRTAAQASGNSGPPACPGPFSFDFNAYLKTPPGSVQQAGTMVQAQSWYRDPADSFGSATSDAVEFPIGLQQPVEEVIRRAEGVWKPWPARESLGGSTDSPPFPRTSQGSQPPPSHPKHPFNGLLAATEGGRRRRRPRGYQRRPSRSAS